MDWIRDHLWETWLGLSIVLGVAEMFSLDLILAMLAAGAVIGMVAAILGLPVVLQIVLALGASVAMLAFVRPTFVNPSQTGPGLPLATASSSAPGPWSPRRSPASQPAGSRPAARSG